MQSTAPILILGASGWLGHYLMPELLRRQPNSSLVAAFASTAPFFQSDKIQAIRLRSSEPDTLKNLKVKVIVNLCRGETPEDFRFHQSLIAYCNEHGARYVYASSYNAVDADVSKPHPESEAPESQSEYGKFKAQCERELEKNSGNFTVFRFSATHGWAPNRIARTEEFLKKLKHGEVVKVSQGVIQNRTFIGDLASMVSSLVLDEHATGLFHLGTSDASEEVIFLRKLALAFGYSEDQVIASDPNPWNAHLLVDRWSKLYPNLPLPTENETIHKVSQQPQLQVFRKSVSI